MLNQKATNEVQKEWAAIQASDAPQEVKRFAFRMMNAALAWRYDVQNLIFQIDEEALRIAEGADVTEDARVSYGRVEGLGWVRDLLESKLTAENTIEKAGPTPRRTRKRAEATSDTD